MDTKISQLIYYLILAAIFAMCFLLAKQRRKARERPDYDGPDFE